MQTAHPKKSVNPGKGPFPAITERVPLPSRVTTPSTLLAAVLLFTFCADLLFLFLVESFGPAAGSARVLLIGLSQTAFLAVLAYFLMYRPMAGYSRQLEQAQQSLVTMASKAILESEEKYRSLVEFTDDSIYLIDREYRYIFINTKHLSRLGMSEEMILGKHYGDFHSPGETANFISQVAGVFETGKSTQQEHKSSRDNLYFLRTLSPIKGPEGAILAVSVISKNITDQKRMEEDLRRLSITDDLTKLYNRRGFLTLTEPQFKLAIRLEKEIFMLYADMDDLKAINDTFGHSEGDRALIDTADVLRKTFREYDVIARIGGDEFAIFPIDADESMVRFMTERFQENLHNHNASQGRVFKLSVTIGISRCNAGDYKSVEDVLSLADSIMYNQKRQAKLI